MPLVLSLALAVNMQAVVATVLVGGASVVVFLLWRAESARRIAWLAAARAALGESFGGFEPAPGTAHPTSSGKLDGAPAAFSVDGTATWARLDVPPPAGVERGELHDMIVRDHGGTVDATVPDVRVGWDDETARLLFRARCESDGAATVGRLVGAARAFGPALPATLERWRVERRERASKTFGEQTGPGGRHARLGLGLTLDPEEWELRAATAQGCEWERSLEDGLPVELRLLVAPADPALADGGARERLVARAATAFLDRLPDGSLPDGAPEPTGQAAPAFAGHPAAACAVDYGREVALGEEEMTRVSYRLAVRGLFLPSGIALLELAAPADRAGKLLDELLAGASFEPPVVVAEPPR